MKAPPDLFRWARWQFDNGAPTHFTPEQAEENCRYLIDVLGERWLIKGMMHPGGDNHPLLRRWAHAGGVDYLALNALASDLRVLEGVPGLGDVLHDVRNIDRSEPAQHTLRSAAQFARVPGGRIEQLFPSDVGGPDYTASTEAGRIAVEAKFMTLSDVQARYMPYAEALLKTLQARVPNGPRLAGRLVRPAYCAAGRVVTSWTSDTHAALPRPVIKVVIKDMARLPTDEAVMAAVADAESAYYGGTLARRGPDFNVFLEPPVDASGLAVSYVLGGRSPKELKRVVARARGASAQLLAENVRGLTGILHAGVHSEDDARDIRALLLPEFDRGTLRGIAAVILSVRRLLVDPSGNVPAMGTAWCVNPRAERPLTRNLPFAMFYGIFKAPHLPPGSEVQVGFIERHDMLTSEMLA